VKGKRSFLGRGERGCLREEGQALCLYAKKTCFTGGNTSHETRGEIGVGSLEGCHHSNKEGGGDGENYWEGQGEIKVGGNCTC